MLPLRARVDLAMKGYSALPKVLALLEPHHETLESNPGHSLGGGSYRSTEVQSMYSTAPADWAMCPIGVNCPWKFLTSADLFYTRSVYVWIRIHSCIYTHIFRGAFFFSLSPSLMWSRMHLNCPNRYLKIFCVYIFASVWSLVLFVCMKLCFV